MNSDQHAFHLEEFKQLKGEIASLAAMASSLVKYSLVAAAAIFTWLATQALGLDVNGPCLKLPKGMVSFAWYVPLGFGLLCGLAALTSSIRVVQMGRYVEKLENALGVSSLGWEGTLKNKTAVFTSLGVVFWVALCIATYIVGSQASDIANGLGVCQSTSTG